MTTERRLLAQQTVTWTGSPSHNSFRLCRSKTLGTSVQIVASIIPSADFFGDPLEAVSPPQTINHARLSSAAAVREPEPALLVRMCLLDLLLNSE